MDDKLLKWLFFSDGHALIFLASKSKSHEKRKYLHSAPTFGTADLNNGDGDTRAGHVWNQLTFLQDGALVEVYYGIAVCDIRTWASAVGVVNGLEVPDRPIEESVFTNKISEKQEFFSEME